MPVLELTDRELALVTKELSSTIECCENWLNYLYRERDKDFPKDWQKQLDDIRQEEENVVSLKAMRQKLTPQPASPPLLLTQETVIVCAPVVEERTPILAVIDVPVSTPLTPPVPSKRGRKPLSETIRRTRSLERELDSTVKKAELTPRNSSLRDILDQKAESIRQQLKDLESDQS